MRLVFDTLVALMLAGLLAGLLIHQRHQEEHQQVVNHVRNQVRVIEQQIMLQAALEKVPRNEYGYPITIDPVWFENELPRNRLVTGPNPWIEVAKDSKPSVEHPHYRVVMHESMAGFWYNPTNGIVRARIPQQVSDQDTLELYNYVNGSHLGSLFASRSDEVDRDMACASPVGFSFSMLVLADSR